jgi:tetratricopeptide (TPR) repeat protein
MTMPKWTAFEETSDYPFDAAKVKKQWARLHRGDAQPSPSEPQVLEAWALFHTGHFQRAAQAGLKAGGAGLAAANKATCIYANYLEPKEATRLALFLEVSQRTEEQIAKDPKDPAAHYWLAYSLGRYSQGISVAKALAQGLGGKVKAALETTIALQPKHADAHIALGAFHAEVIDKVGSLIGGMTYGAKKETGLKLFQTALALHPESTIGMVEYANALVMLQGDKAMKEATRWYEQAASCKPLDAMQHLDVDLARSELAH